MNRRSFVTGGSLALFGLPASISDVHAGSISEFLMAYQINHLPQAFYPASNVARWFDHLVTNTNHADISSYILRHIQADFQKGHFSLLIDQYRSTTECMIISFQSYNA